MQCPECNSVEIKNRKKKFLTPLYALIGFKCNNCGEEFTAIYAETQQDFTFKRAVVSARQFQRGIDACSNYKKAPIKYTFRQQEYDKVTVTYEGTNTFAPDIKKTMQFCTRCVIDRLYDDTVRFIIRFEDNAQSHCGFPRFILEEDGIPIVIGQKFQQVEGLAKDGFKRVYFIVK